MIDLTHVHTRAHARAQYYSAAVRENIEHGFISAKQ